MTYNPDKHHRRSIRLQGYDYAQAGAYFVTICTQNRQGLFGDIADGKMRLNDAGTMIQTVWDEIPPHYPGIDIDAFIVMPNHIHGIIIIDTPHVGAGPRACPDSPYPAGAGPRACPDSPYPAGAGPRACPDTENGRPRGAAPTMSLSDVVHRFKTMTTKRYADGVKQHHWPPFPGKLWQRNYYEHIIRNENALNRIRQYIAENPARWETDRENPQCTGSSPDPTPLWAALHASATLADFRPEPRPVRAAPRGCPDSPQSVRAAPRGRPNPEEEE